MPLKCCAAADINPRPCRVEGTGAGTADEIHDRPLGPSSTGLSAAVGIASVFEPGLKRALDVQSSAACYSPDLKPRARTGLVSVIIRIVASSTPALRSFGMKVSIRYV